jgi:hypothetical protein
MGQWESVIFCDLPTNWHGEGWHVRHCGPSGEIRRLLTVNSPELHMLIDIVNGRLNGEEAAQCLREIQLCEGATACGFAVRLHFPIGLGELQRLLSFDPADTDPPAVGQAPLTQVASLHSGIRALNIPAPVLATMIRATRTSD